MIALQEAYRAGLLHRKHLVSSPHYNNSCIAWLFVKVQQITGKSLAWN